MQRLVGTMAVYLDAVNYAGPGLSLDSRPPKECVSRWGCFSSLRGRGRQPSCRESEAKETGEVAVQACGTFHGRPFGVALLFSRRAESRRDPRFSLDFRLPH